MHKRSSFTGQYSVDGNVVGVSVPVYLWSEDGITYAMAPALDITGYGKSEAEAKRSFEVMLQEFVSYTHRKKTIYKVLEGLGWTTNRKKKRVVPPAIEDLIQDNEDVREMIARPGVRRYEEKMAVQL